jgi:nucleoside-diphosphate-sugar epimerase
MKILVTGGAGFLGSHLCETLLQREHEVWAIDAKGESKILHLLDHPAFHFVRETIFNDAMLEDLVRRSDLVFHLAGVVGVEHYVGDPYAVLNVNINGTQRVLQVAHKWDKKMVFASTSEIYGRNTKVPFKEDDDRVLGSTRIDRWCYSTSKAAAEHFCFAYAKIGLPVVIVRYFNVYGPRLDRIDVGRVLTIFMGQILKNKPLTVIGDGSQTRCFTYVSDAIEGTIAAGIRPQAVGGIFNLGTDTEITIRTLAETMLEIAGRPKTMIEYVPQEKVYGTSYEDIPRRVPDATRMRTILGVDMKVGLREGLERTMSWFMKEAH